MRNMLLNNWLKVSVMGNGDLLLANIKRDKNTGDVVKSTIAIYADKLNLLLDVVNLLVKHTVFHRQISPVDGLIRLATEIAGYRADEFKELGDKRSW